MNVSSDISEDSIENVPNIKFFRDTPKKRRKKKNLSVVNSNFLMIYGDLKSKFTQGKFPLHLGSE